MAVNADGEVIGSVSGGCVEGAVVTEALDVLATGAQRMVTFGYSDDDAFAVGLTCGGTVHLFIEPLDVDGRPARRRAATTSPAVLATVVDGPGAGDKLLLVEGAGARRPARRPRPAPRRRCATREAASAAATTSVRRYGACGEANEDTVTVFFEAFAPPPRLLIFGAVDFTAALVRVAKVLGFHVTVCDAREVFATKARFPLADEVVVDWPHRLLAEVGDALGPRDAVCVLTHDAKFDVPAIVAALATEGRVPRRHGLAAHHRAARRAPAGRGRHRRAARPAAGPDRPRPRRPHARGDGGGDLRRDHRPAHRAGRAPPQRRRRPHPLSLPGPADG